MPQGLAIATVDVSFPLLAPNGSAVAPSYSFAASPSTGMYSYGAGGIAFSAGGVDQYYVNTGGLGMFTGRTFYLNSGGTTALYGGTPGVLLLLDGSAANNPQELRVYGTSVGPKYLSLAHNGTNGVIGTDGILYLAAGSGGITLTGGFANLLWATDNTYDIGASGATRPRNVYAGTKFILPSSGGQIDWENTLSLLSPLADYFRIQSYGAAKIVNLGVLASTSLQLGYEPSATPVAQTFTIGEASRPGTDTDVGGANGTIRSGLGTGTGTPSALSFETPAVAASGSGVQSYGIRMLLDVAGLYVVASILAGGNITATGYLAGVEVFATTRVILNGTTYLHALAAASLRLGGDPSATPVAQTFTVGEASRPGTDLNVAGSNGTIRSGLGTGNAAGSSLLFLTPDPIASSTVAQTYGQRLSLSALGATFDIPDQSFRINGQVSGAGVSSGTLTNAPAAGNPNFWLPLNVNGTVYMFPGW